METHERILLIKPSSLGDIIHSLQVMESFRVQRAGAIKITWVVRDTFAPFVEACTLVDKVLIYERFGGLKGFRRLLQEIRAEEYDIAVDMQGLARSAAMLFRAKAARKMGRRDAREGAILAYPEKPMLPPEGKEAHAVDILREFLPVMGVENQLAGALTFQEPPASRNIHQLLDRVDLSRPTFLLFPESRRPEKEWPYFKRLTQLLLSEQSGVNVIWAGSNPTDPADHWPRNRFLNLCGQTKIDELPHLIKNVSVVVANDSGPMHLAAAMAKPVLAIFGPTELKRYGPYPPGAPGRDVITAPDGDLTALSVESVYAKLLVTAGIDE